MKFGYFDDSNREYVITNPQTPWPWINYLGNEDFFSLISNTAGGYSFYKDAKFRRITRYRYNNVPMDNGGRYFYIKDEDTVWSPGWKPCKTPLDSYECRHGMNYTTIEGKKNGVSAKVLFFVPLKTWAEVQKVTLTNHTDGVKKIKLFSFQEWCLWNAATDMENFQRNFSTGEVEIEGSVIYHKTEYKERRDHYAYYSVNTPIQGYDTDRESFVGLYNGFEAPQVVVEGKPRMTEAHGWSPVASHYIEVELKAGESKDFVFVLGYVENKEDEKWESKNIINKTKAKAVIARFDTAAKVDAALAELKAYWNNLLSVYSVTSGDEKLDRMVNIWNQYQCMITFCFSRSASFFESGIGRGMGFRDSNQDLIGFVHQIPERARERIIDIASTQFPDGGCYHQYQPLTKRGNNDIGGGFNDDPMWLILGTTSYIKESGDFSILNEMVPFDNDMSVARTLFDHLTVSFDHVVNNLGPHGLPLIGRADWNDCLNLNCFSEEPGESFQTCGNFESGKAESVFIAGMFVQYGREYAELCRRFGDPAEGEEVLRAVADMEKSVLAHGWDGEWYLRAYDAFGNKVGSKECGEGKIFVEPQGFCALAGIGRAEGLCEKALHSAREHLLNDFGLELLWPPYTTYRKELGEITSYPPGYKENGSVFSHNNPWVSIAAATLGRGDEAFDLYRRICPAYVEELSEIHGTEPYVYSQTIAGRASKRLGQAKNSWLTGTAAWAFVGVTQYILGIRPDYDALIVRPVLPKSLEGFEARRLFRGTVYDIRVRRGGEPGLWIDGARVEGDRVPVQTGRARVSVEVALREVD